MQSLKLTQKFAPARKKKVYLKGKLPSGKLTWQWKLDLFEDVFPIENGDFPLPS